MSVCSVTARNWRKVGPNPHIPDLWKSQREMKQRYRQSHLPLGKKMKVRLFILDPQLKNIPHIFLCGLRPGHRDRLKLSWTGSLRGKSEKVKVLVIQSCPTLCNPTDCSPSASSAMEFSRQEPWSGLSFPSPGDLPHPGIEPGSPALQVDSSPSEPPGKSETRRIFSMWQLREG